MDTHLGFCDESNYNTGRYRAVSLVSTLDSFFPEYNRTLQTILEQSNVAELKWAELSSARMRHAVIKSIDYSLRCAYNGELRIDTLCWDIQDSRHTIMGRDDITNLSKMIYHLINNVITRRWGESGFWTIFTDEQQAIDWKELETILRNRIRSLEKQKQKEDPDETLHLYLNKINQVESHNCRPVQIADIFAGMGWHSRKFYRKHIFYYIVQNSCTLLGEKALKTGTDIVNSLSSGERERCHIIYYLLNTCKKNRWGVHILRTNGLRTTNLHSPINFWQYTPQSEHDKAPIKY